MKKTLISVGLLSLLIAGCNLTDFRLPTLGGSDPLIEEMCATAKKNEVRANELYRGRVVSAKGKFRVWEGSGKIYTSIDFDTLNFSVHMSMNDKTEPWKQYDNGQIVSSGNVIVSNVSVESYSGYDICYIFN